MLQTAQQQTPSTAPTTPAPYIVPVASVPRTKQELEALRIKRSELSDQLQSAVNRRSGIAAQLKTADAAARTGLEARLKVLDDRIVRLETEIDRSGELLANTPAHVIAGASSPADMVNRMDPEVIIPIVAIISIFVLMPFAIAMARLIWKRASQPRPVVDHATQQRLEQLQQSMDTIAIEVERISEGQRFVTKLLSEKDRAALGAGAAEPAHAARKSAVPSERG